MWRTIVSVQEINNHHQPSKSRSWGSSLAPLLPRSLRDAWVAETLPRWVQKDLGLGDDATFGSLGLLERATSYVFSDRMRSFLTFVVQSRRATIHQLVALNHPWPADIHFLDVPWQRRTRNCLLNAGLDERLNELPRMTFGELFDIRGMGAASGLDFTCTLEAFMDHSGPAAVAVGESQWFAGKRTRTRFARGGPGGRARWHSRRHEVGDRRFSNLGLFPLQSSQLQIRSRGIVRRKVHFLRIGFRRRTR